MALGTAFPIIAQVNGLKILGRETYQHNLENGKLPTEGKKMMIKSNLASSLKISGQRTDGVLILV